MEINKSFASVVRHGVIACFVFALVFCIYGCIVSPNLNLLDFDAEVYEGEWLFEKSDGTTEAFLNPKLLDVENGETVRVSTVLPEDVDDGMYFYLISGRSFDAYVNDEKIYSFDAKISNLPGRAVKGLHFIIPLRDEYAGQKLTIVRSDNNTFNGKMNECYIGNILGIIKLAVSGRMVQFLCAFFTAIISAITLIVFVIISKTRKKTLPLVYLAEGVFAISLWIIFDNTSFQLCFDRIFVDGVISYMLAILLATPFLHYVDEIQEHRFRNIYVILELASLLNFIVLTVLHFAEIMDYEAALYYIDLWLIIDLVVILVITIKDYFIDKHREYKLVLYGFIGLILMALSEVLYILISVHLIYSSDFDGILIMLGMIILLFFAVWEQIQALNEIQKKSQKAIAATRAKSDFLANMSHEIRTPINAIMGMNEMILRECEQDSIREYSKDIESASENLLEVVNDILDFSKIEAGMLEIVEDDYDLGEIIYDVTSLVNMKAEAKGLRLKVYVDPEIPSLLHGDDKRIRETMTNILNNAVKYTQKGKVELKVDGDYFGDQFMLIIGVADTGIGIKPEDLDKIFDGFERVDEKKNKGIEGSGLGLSITKKLVELMNGIIEVKSEYEKGSEFTITIPQKVVGSSRMGDYTSHKHASKQNEEKKYGTFTAPNASILVVDDNQLNLNVITRLLAKTQMNIVCALSGREALDIMQEKEFDVILLDHMMPNLDGIETLQQAKHMRDNKCKNAPIIALTANAIVGAKEKYIEAGFVDYLSKPVVPLELENMLIKYIPKEKVKLID